MRQDSNPHKIALFSGIGTIEKARSSPDSILLLDEMVDWWIRQLALLQGYDLKRGDLSKEHRDLLPYQLEN